MMKKIIILLLSITILSCASDNDEVNYDAQNETDILKYLSDNDLSAEKTASGLYYIIKNIGTGNQPTSNSNVTTYYKGYLLDGTVFDKSNASGATFNLNQLIPGFSEGMQLLKEGGKATLIIPSRLAYGNRGSGSIKPGAVIVFDVQLFSIN